MPKKKKEQEVPEIPVIELDQTPAFDEVQKLKGSIEDKTAQSEFKSLLNQMEKEFGEGIIANGEELLKVEKIPTRVLLLDILLKGGLPKSSIILCWGETGSWKTWSLLRFASVFTTQKIPVLYIDAEHAFDKDWATKNGNDMKYFYVSQPAELEKAINICDVAVRSRKFGLVIFDSVTAAVPKAVIDKDAYQQYMGLQARLNATLCTKITSGLQSENLKNPDLHNDTIVALVAHLREKIGVMYGNPETIPGGHALRHLASYILKFSKGQILKEKDTIVGREMRVKIEKARHSKPLVSGVTDFMFDPPRVNNAKTLILYATQLGLIQRSGAYYSYQDIKAQGQAELFKALYAKPELLEQLRADIIREIN